MSAAFRSDLPPADGPWAPPPPFSFVGGHNDRDSIPFGGLAEAAMSALRREGRNLATYNLGGSPLGYAPLRHFVADALGRRASMDCDAEEVLITSGSLQALDLVNAAFCAPGDTVLVEQATYGGMLGRLRRLGVDWEGVPLDEHGIVPSGLAAVLDDLAARGVTPKYLYTIPTVQNPTGSVLPVERRRAVLDLVRAHGVAVFEDECYADLTWGCPRPPTIRALDDGGGQVVYCGSFSKSIGPALRVGYLVADPPVIRQLSALKSDAGTGALEQLTLAEFGPAHFDDHVDALMVALRSRCDAMLGAVADEFGASVSVTPPQGGIYVWVTFPEGVDTAALVAPAAAAGVEFNPGAGWSADPADGSRRLRLCFGHVEPDVIRQGVAALAGVAREVTGLPLC